MSVLSAAGALWECNLASSLSETIEFSFHEQLSEDRIKV